MNINLLCACLVFFCSLLAQGVIASDLEIKLNTINDTPVADGVVELVPQFKLPDSYQYPNVETDVAQKNRTFVPFVSAVQKGSNVEFPNFDKTRHHVYSFSEAKTFELELYVGRPENSVLFDKAGIVSVGCNIHDYMQAYLYIGESPFLGVSDESGRVYFKNIPNGKYEVNVWHPWQIGDFTPQTVESSKQSLTFNIDIESRDKPAPPESKWQNLFKEND